MSDLFYIVVGLKNPFFLKTKQTKTHTNPHPPKKLKTKQKQLHNPDPLPLKIQSYKSQNTCTSIRLPVNTWESYHKKEIEYLSGPFW